MMNLLDLDVEKTVYQLSSAAGAFQKSRVFI